MFGALAAASRVLRGFDDRMSDECLQLAERVWNDEHKQPPALFQYFNTTGSNLQHAELEAAVQLLISTRGGQVYKERLTQLLPVIKEQFGFLGGTASRALPWMDESFKKEFADALAAYKPKLLQMMAQNPTVFRSRPALGAVREESLTSGRKCTFCIGHFRK